jgi:hypothetical protein
MSDMTLKQALSIVSEAGHLRAEMWDAAYNEGTVLYGSDVLDCFEESSKDEANVMGKIHHEAVQVINRFRERFGAFIDDCYMGED